MLIIAATVAGLVPILLALRDMVHELFHPELSGSMSRRVMRAVWRTLRALGRVRRGVILHAGPIILIAVVTVWAAMLALGWALIYWPRLPTEFHVAQGLPESAARGFGTALYVSLAALTSVGENDVSPVAGPVRILLTLESLVGLMLISAWITRVLSIYPVIADRRAFTREVILLRAAEPPPEVAVTEPPLEAAIDILRTLTEQVIRIDSALQQSPITYYFQSEAPEVSLAHQLPWVLAYGRAAESKGPEPAIRRHGALLRRAVEQLTADIGAEFLDLPHAPPEKVLAAMAEDHLLPPAIGSRG